jgi:rubrerythrin
MNRKRKIYVAALGHPDGPKSDCEGCGTRLAARVVPSHSRRLCRACKRFEQRAKKITSSPPVYKCNVCVVTVVKKGQKICPACDAKMSG